MRVVRSIGFFFIWALLFLVTGYLLGAVYSPGAVQNRGKILNLGSEDYTGDPSLKLQEQGEVLCPEGTYGIVESVPEDQKQRSDPDEEYGSAELAETEEFTGFLDVSALSMVLATDTEYVTEEMDVRKGTVVETTGRLPEKYVGMDRETFLMSMEQYAQAPPLSERERGFVGLEVLSFSRERVVVQMKYEYVQPGECFYLALLNHEIVVLLEDKETIYISTGISADLLSKERQEELIHMIYVEDETSLYDFLEAYSS